MTVLVRLALVASLAAASLACGDTDDPATDDVGTTSGDGDGDGDATTGGDGDGDGDGEWQGLTFEPLITDDWVQAPGTEHYECAALTMTEDVYVAGFRSLSPNGTHHTVLSIGSPGEDGPFECGAASLGHNMLFASGVGTDDLIFPQGVAIKIEAGQRLILNLHLFNATDSDLTGVSGTEVALVSAAEVEQFAEVVFGGNQFFTIASQPNETQHVYGACAFKADATVVALWPHMHQLGTHMTVRHGDTVLHDAPFDFEEQVNYKLTPYQVKADETLDVRCSFVNNTGSPVTWGDSSEQEMCFVGVYRYPATGAGLFDCVASGAPWPEDQ